MIQFAAIVALSSMPNTAQTIRMPMPVPVASTFDEPDLEEWRDILLKLLEYLCEILGPEYCWDDDAEEASTDDIMLNFIDAYQLTPPEPGLTSPERTLARMHIEDLYDHVQNPNDGTASVVAAMEETLVNLYEDLGGDPGDL